MLDYYLINLGKLILCLLASACFFCSVVSVLLSICTHADTLMATRVSSPGACTFVCITRCMEWLTAYQLAVSSQRNWWCPFIIVRLHCPLIHATDDILDPGWSCHVGYVFHTAGAACVLLPTDDYSSLFDWYVPIEFGSTFNTMW
jgi:hypothetical protein